MADRFLGIDFSGGAAAWRPAAKRPAVWIATIEGDGCPALVDLRPVQELAGEGPPFARLASLLRAGTFVAAAIDAPFCLPARHLPPGGQPALLAAVAALRPALDRPFPRGPDLVALATAIAPLDTPKPLRATEQVWRMKGVNTRSTLWNGPRPGAPFAAACLTLLAQARRPMWPWATGPDLLAEAFPAAQLRSWGLPHAGYAKPDQRPVREAILAGLRSHIAIPPARTGRLLETPDALDAVLAAFGAIAAARAGTVPHPPDGWIAVADGPPSTAHGTAG